MKERVVIGDQIKNLRKKNDESESEREKRKREKESE